MSNPTPSITLTRLSPPDPVDPLQEGVSLVVLAQGLHMPSEVFVYHLGLAEDPLPADLFEAVASPRQMDLLPVRTGLTTTEIKARPYYRHNILSFNCVTQEEADRTWQLVQEDVNLLVRQWVQRMTSDRPVEVVVCTGA